MLLVDSTGNKGPCIYCKTCAQYAGMISGIIEYKKKQE